MKNFVEPETPRTLVARPARGVPERCQRGSQYIFNRPTRLHCKEVGSTGHLAGHSSRCQLMMFSFSLAYNEMRSVMACMIWHFDMRLCAETEDWEKQGVFCMREKPPLNVRLSHQKLNLSLPSIAADQYDRKSSKPVSGWQVSRSSQPEASNEKFVGGNTLL